MKEPVEGTKRKRFANGCDKVTKPARADPVPSTLKQQANNKLSSEIDHLLVSMDATRLLGTRVKSHLKESLNELKINAEKRCWA